MKNKMPIIEQILMEKPKTRGDDYLLYLEYLKKIGKDNLLKLTLEQFLEKAGYLRISSIESVSRTRRRVQQNNRFLKPTQEIRKIREEKRKEILKWWLSFNK